MKEFTNNIINLHGDLGRKWLGNLDSIIANLSRKWHLTELVAFDNLTFNYVMRGFQYGIPIVLKIGFELDLLKNEAAALKFFENYGAAKLLDSTDGALLLERCVPGTSLKKYFPDKEKESLQIAAHVIKKLHSSNQTPNTFGKIEDLLSGLNCHSQKAKNIAEELLKTTEKKIVLHGDLHHDNILKHNDEWKIIDPSAVVGDPTYEIASFMINPIDELWRLENAVEVVQNRLSEFSKLLNVDPIRIAKWSFVKAVLCWIWTPETPDTQNFQKKSRSELVKLFNMIVD